MSTSLSDEPVDPEAARLAAKIRWLMLISGLTTVLAIGAVLAVIGYRVFKAEGSAAMSDITAALPKGARIIGTAVADDRLAVTIDTGAGIEVRTFDLKSLKPLGRLRFTSEP